MFGGNRNHVTLWLKYRLFSVTGTVGWGRDIPWKNTPHGWMCVTRCFCYTVVTILRHQQPWWRLLTCWKECPMRSHHHHLRLRILGHHGAIEIGSIIIIIIIIWQRCELYWVPLQFKIFTYLLKGMRYEVTSSSSSSSSTTWLQCYFC